MTLGEKLFSLRDKKGVSQETLADDIGVSCQAVANWEQDTLEPGRGDLIKLCEYFNVPVEYMVYDNVLKPDRKDKRIGIVLLVVGLMLLFITVMSTYPAKLYEFQILGHCFEHEVEYLTKFPFNVALVISLILTLLGIYKILKKNK